MKSKNPEKAVEQRAAELIADYKVRIKKNDLGGVGVEFMTPVNQPDKVDHVANIRVTIYRSDDKKDIYYPVWIDSVGTYDLKSRVLTTSDTAKEAFAIKDLLDDMIKAFREGTSHGPK